MSNEKTCPICGNWTHDDGSDYEQAIRADERQRCAERARTACAEFDTNDAAYIIDAIMAGGDE